MSGLFTIISLMIGLFGASISTIWVIRQACERKVNQNLANADEKIKEMGIADCAEESLQEADKRRDKIANCREAFRSLSLVPSIIFLIWIFLTSFYVSLSPDCKTLFDHPKKNSQKSEIVDPNKTTQQQNPSQSSIQMLCDAISMLLKSILFRRWTILIITLIDGYCVWCARRKLKDADKEYKEVEKLHTASMREKKGGLKKTSTTPSKPRKARNEKRKNFGEETS